MKMKTILGNMRCRLPVLRLGWLLSVTVALTVFVFPPSVAAAPSQRTALCHLMKSGEERLILVSDSQVQRHLQHGDRLADSYFADQDGDGFGAAETFACDPAEGLSDNNLDCNDADATVNPGAVDTPFDATDNNCDGTICPCYNAELVQAYFDEAATLPWGSLQCTTVPQIDSEAREMFDIADAAPRLSVFSGATVGNRCRLDFVGPDGGAVPSFPSVDPIEINDAERSACITQIRATQMPDICFD
jgi:hypothetical protein